MWRRDGRSQANFAGVTETPRALRAVRSGRIMREAVCAHLRKLLFKENRSGAEDFINSLCQREIVVADPLYAVGIQVDHHFIPHVEPFRMMVHGFGH